MSMPCNASLKYYFFWGGGGEGFAFALIFIVSRPGVKPYPGLTTTELISEFRKGYRLENSSGCSDAM